MQKIVEIQKYLNTKFFEREKEIEALLTALLSGQHMLLIGPAGTGKSALASELSQMIEGANYFQWLLTRFSTPEELFGPLDLQQLKAGNYVRNVKGKLPEAHLAFLDEIFKSNSAILNSLLTLINERLFYNNGTPTRTPLITLVGASNEYPEEDEGLEALFDRFLLRFETDYIGDDQNFISMLKGGNNVPIQRQTLTLTELQEMQFMCEMVTISDEVYSTLVTIRRALKDEGIRPSDRRFKQSLSLVKAKAMIEQRQEARVEDLLILEHVLWETVDQKDIVAQIIKANAQDEVSAKLEELEREFKDVVKNYKENVTTETSLETVQKLKAIGNELKKLSSKHGHDRQDRINEMLTKVAEEKNAITEAVLDI